MSDEQTSRKNLTVAIKAVQDAKNETALKKKRIQGDLERNFLKK